MTIEDAVVYGKQYISSTETKILIASVMGHDTLEIINYLHQQMTPEQEELFKKLVNARRDNIPVQYITNSVNFYGLELYVDENVLIPRFETEELVENTVKILKERFNNPKVLDLCCGSGAIGLAIKDKIESNVSMSDISKGAICVATKNKDKLNLDVEIIESDLFQNINDKYDCIISNPPYIKTDEEIEDIVKYNEPYIALYGGKDGLDYYEKILKDIKLYLNPNFLIAFEIGETQKDDVINIANKYLDNIEIIAKKDLSGRDRMIFIMNKLGN